MELPLEICVELRVTLELFLYIGEVAKCILSWYYPSIFYAYTGSHTWENRFWSKSTYTQIYRCWVLYRLVSKTFAACYQFFFTTTLMLSVDALYSYSQKV
jgi:hypothetical protein